MRNKTKMILRTLEKSVKHLPIKTKCWLLLIFKMFVWNTTIRQKIWKGPTSMHDLYIIRFHHSSTVFFHRRCEIFLTLCIWLLMNQRINVYVIGPYQSQVTKHRFCSPSAWVMLLMCHTCFCGMREGNEREERERVWREVAWGSHRPLCPLTAGCYIHCRLCTWLCPLFTSYSALNDLLCLHKIYYQRWRKSE